MLLGKRLLFSLLIVVVVMQFSLPARPVFAASTSAPIQFVSEEIISEGTVLQKYIKVLDGKSSTVYVTKVDLNNPYVKVAPLYGKNGVITEKQSVENMVEERGAVAAVNADFFNMNKKGTPFGIVLDEEQLISSMGHLDRYHSLGITSDNTAVIAQFSFAGEIKAEDGVVYPLRGVNKEEYNASDGPSHKDHIYMFTPHFGSKSLGPLNGSTLTVELVVVNDTVQQVRENQPAADIPAKGYVMWGEGKGGEFLKDHFAQGSHVQVSYLTTPDQAFSAVGGHALLVNEGQVPGYFQPAVEGVHPRTAAGVSADGKTLLLVVVEGYPYSRGMTMKELAELMVELGSWRAVNLDGGGSTTMVARHLGDTDASLINVTKFGSQRSVPTAVGIFNTAPRGEFAGMVISGPQSVLKGSTTTYETKGYDEHYHPYELSAGEVSWLVEDENHGTFSGNQFTAESVGQVLLTAHYRDVMEEYAIQVLGANDIEKLAIVPGELFIREGDTVNLSVQVKAKNGTVFDATPQSVHMKESGGIGSVNGFAFTADNKPGVGSVVAEYDGLTTSIPVRVGTVAQPWLTFDHFDQTYHTGHPENISSHGSFTMTGNGEPVYRSEKALKLNYNFAGVPAGEVRIAYGRMGKEPVTMPGNPLRLGVWVYGDNSGHWLRAEVIDGQGNRHLVNLAQKVDWKGWRYVTGDIPYNVAYPLSLKSLYLVNLPEGAENRPLKGTVYFDELVLYQPYDPVKVPKEEVFHLQSGNANELPFSLGREMTVSMDASSLKGKVETVEIEPVSVIPVQTPGIIPVDYGFEFLPEENIKTEYAPEGVKAILTPHNWPQHVSVGLLWLNPQTGKWQEVKGEVLDSGSWSFPVEQWGLYLPYYAKNPFTDIRGHWAEKAVMELYSRDIIKGLSSNQYGPEFQLTRGQFVTLLDRIFKWSEQNTSGTASFTDQIPNWANAAVQAANRLGIVKGYADGTFRANEPLTRSQMAAFLDRALESANTRQVKNLQEAEKMLASTYGDWNKIPEWARLSVAELTVRSYMKGSGGNFQPQGITTRAQAAQLLYNILP